MAVAFFFQFLDRYETERGGIDTVSKSIWTRPIVKDVAEMGIAFRAADFGPIHSHGAIGFLDDLFFGDRFGETGPAASAIEFVERSEEWFAGDHINVNPWRVIVPVGVVERGLGATFLCHVVLLGRQLLL